MRKGISVVKMVVPLCFMYHLKPIKMKEVDLLEVVNVVGKISINEFSNHDKPNNPGIRVFTCKESFDKNQYYGFYAISASNELMYWGIFRQWGWSNIRNNKNQAEQLSKKEYYEIEF